jgi:putative nucleotidyltransferase with HDIG domain
MTSVLVADDEPVVREMVTDWVVTLGLQTESAKSADAALDTLRERHYDLAVVDVMMAGHDGLWLGEQLHRDYPHTAVVIATTYTRPRDDGEVHAPIAGFLAKPFPGQRGGYTADRSRRWRKEAFDDLWDHAQLSIELEHRVAAINDAVRDLMRSGTSASDALTTITAERAPDLVEHSSRVARYATAVAREFGLDADVPAIELAARFHDIGKMAMTRALLSKREPLTPGERAIMRRHIEIGADILAATDVLRDAAPVVRATHEWFGGGGYPYRLRGTAIPVVSRIIAVVDAFDAMTHPRPYRALRHPAEAIVELRRSARTQFDPDIVDAFLELRDRN